MSDRVGSRTLHAIVQSKSVDRCAFGGQVIGKSLSARASAMGHGEGLARVLRTVPSSTAHLPGSRVPLPENAGFSPDRLVAALVVMIQQANRNGRVDTGTLAPSNKLRTA